MAAQVEGKSFFIRNCNAACLDVFIQIYSATLANRSNSFFEGLVFLTRNRRNIVVSRLILDKLRTSLVPLVARRCADGKISLFANLNLFNSTINGNQLAIHGTLIKSEHQIMFLIIRGQLDIAVDRARVIRAASNDYSNTRIFLKAANIKRILIVCSALNFLRCYDRCILDRDHAVVVRQRKKILKRLEHVRAIQRHVVQRQRVAVVLNQNLQVRLTRSRNKLTIFQGNLVAGLEVRSLRLAAAAADKRAVERVGMRVEVNRQALAVKRIGLDLDTVAEAVFQKQDGIAVLCLLKRLCQSGVGADISTAARNLRNVSNRCLDFIHGFKCTIALLFLNLNRLLSICRGNLCCLNLIEH